MGELVGVALQALDSESFGGSFLVARGDSLGDKLETWRFFILLLNHFNDLLLQHFSRVVDDVNIFEEADTHHVPFVAVERVREDMRLCFFYEGVELIIVFPIFDIRSRADLGDPYPAYNLFFLALDGMDLNRH